MEYMLWTAFKEQFSRFGLTEKRIFKIPYCIRQSVQNR
ncbi:hypothetical protein LEP1GSC050_3411 [Leptospira broomii serovar Hurstbridge str. 5399]|uniref:Uncharacterized protein n=1 Tax=Leptospira broomii serovar Hurstbridge str. 5399 TaxID=1049789 RepID=T0GGI1_9LEPT|nr:hypothetical protein LEP1GSC050_3411 [Leptospira broomii serovar Hurstbridge str. 5399]